MASEPQSTSKADRSKNSAQGKDRLPFEPQKNRKKSAKTPAVTTVAAKQENKPSSASKEDRTIPEAVSQRMIRRMALFSGIPTSLGIGTFILSYFVVTNAWFKLPNIAVVLVSMGFFGLGVLGLSYGVLSASWDAETPGSKFGWEQFTTNLGRMISAWRASRQKN